MYAIYPIEILSNTYLGGIGPCLLGDVRMTRSGKPISQKFLNIVGFTYFLPGPLEILAIGSGSSLLTHPRAVQWLAPIAFASFTTVHMQYLRDRDGDKLRNRRTVPLAIGDASARWLVVIAVLMWSSLALVFCHLGMAGFLLPVSTGLVMELTCCPKERPRGVF